VRNDRNAEARVLTLTLASEAPFLTSPKSIIVNTVASSLNRNWEINSKKKLTVTPSSKWAKTHVVKVGIVLDEPCAVLQFRLLGLYECDSTIELGIAVRPTRNLVEGFAADYFQDHDRNPGDGTLSNKQTTTEYRRSLFRVGNFRLEIFDGTLPS
jgi:hypothetical protein